jgi:signal transduction histidine kinase
MVTMTAAVCAAAVLVDLQVSAEHRRLAGLEPAWASVVTALVMAWAGAAVLGRDSRHPVGWLLSGFGLWWAVDALASAWLGFATASEPVLSGASLAFVVYQRLGSGLLLVLPLLLVLFPHGRLPEGRWRLVALSALAATALLPLVLVAAPSRVAQDIAGDGALPAPFRSLDLDLVSLPLPDGLYAGLLRAAYLLLTVSLVPAVAVVVHRLRGATGVERARMRWLLWAGVVDALVILTSRVLPGVLVSAALVVAVAVTSVAVAIGITRPDVVDVDRLLGTTLLYGCLVVGSVLVDVLVLGGTSWLIDATLDSRESLVVAVIVTLVIYIPLRHRLSRVVRRWVVGERDDPYAVVSALAQRLEDSTGPDEQLLEVARSLGTAFRLPFVGVEVQQGAGEVLVVEHGVRPEATRALPIAYRGEEVGRLILPEHGSTARLRPADERLLADVVRQAAAAARTARLADELQRSREQLVTAVEDERRRLRRDLHDGLGPTLAAVASRIDMARITARRDPDATDAALAAARADISGMLTEVRRLVHGLRPPALDEVGLVGAVRRQAASVTAGLEISVEATGDLSTLPAAVEVAAYRIVAEALTNVARHSRARHARVRLSGDHDALEVEIADDGDGIPQGTPAGVGLVSLRERAEELGGRCEVLDGMPGTVVRAVLPLSSPAAARALAAAVAR